MTQRKKIVLSFVGVLVIFIGSIIALEFLSRTSNCSTTLISRSMPACSNNLYTDDSNTRNYLNELSEKYSQGISPSPEELEKAVIEVDRDSIGGANGVYCGGVAFVSNDLSVQAELYVRRHELEHVLQFMLQMEEQNYESAANYAAAKEYPIGMIETVIFSVIKARDHFDSTTCYLVTLWKIFKIYFLPFAAS
jgi:hypothetical protein